MGLLAVVSLVCACTQSDKASSATSTTRRSAASPTTAQPARSGESDGCKAPPQAAGRSDQVLSSGGQERHFLLDIPEGYSGSEPYPLVFALHSLTVDYHIVPDMGGFGEMHQKYKFIDVSPSGLVSSAPYWNAAPVQDNYDVRYITDLLDHLEQTLCINTSQVFSIGMSNGAQMSSLLACRLKGRITGIAPIAGVEYNDPCPTAPVPVIAFHGKADPYVPYKGGGLNSVTIANENFYKGKVPAGTATPTGVDESMARWAHHNGCDPSYDDARPLRS